MKIYMCCHKDYDIIPPLCLPIQGGRAINPPIEKISGDDTGDNISEKNREYCELTVQYYAWKNIDEDYYGFCHYRRFFCFDRRVKKPYIAVGKITPKNAELLGNEQEIINLCQNYDVILPKSEDIGVSVQEHYISSKHHYKEDLQLFLDILNKTYPQLSDAAEEYLSQNRSYFCNMFIMKKDYFHEYCQMLFTLLSEYDSKKSLHGSFQDDRTDGYLGERFVGIYLTYIRSKGAKICSIARLDAFCSFQKRLKYHLFPPESKLRAFARKLQHKIKG